MKAVILVLFVAVAAFFFPREARSQVSYEGCYVGAGFPVASIATPAVNDIAVATYLPNGAPVVYYNPYVVASVNPQTRVFFYYHECAHHVLGHGLGTTHPLAMEQNADCWAITNLVRSGRFSDYDIQVVQGDLTIHARGDWTHLPGQQRAINLYACLG